MKSVFFFIEISMSCITACIFISCNHRNQEEQQAFYYYPSKNIYYDIARERYLYSLNGAISWDSMHLNSQNPSVVLGNKIILYATTDSIWKDNEQHRKLYAGNIYTIINEDNRFDSAYNETREKKQLKKNVKEPAREQKPKKGFQKFIESIFKKNKNK